MKCLMIRGYTKIRNACFLTSFDIEMLGLAVVPFHFSFVHFVFIVTVEKILFMVIIVLFQKLSAVSIHSIRFI